MVYLGFNSMLPSNVAPRSRCPRRSQTSEKKNEKYYLFGNIIFRKILIL